MPDQFAEALERLEVNFDNIGEDFEIFGLLHQVLDRMPTRLQTEIAQAKLAFERRAFLLEGFTIGFFTRQGRLVTQLRDARGRFVISGAAAVQRFLDRL